MTKTTQTTQYEYHTYANIFPLIEGGQFDELKEDIKTHGLLQPVILYEGKILDGRNRYRACLAIGLEPRYEQYEGIDPLGYVISLNLKRRHMTKEQLAAVAVQNEALLSDLQARARERQKATQIKSGAAPTVAQKVAEPKESLQQLAEVFQTNKQYVKEAKAVKERAPEAFAAVVKGDKGLRDAYQDLKKDERRAVIAAQIEQIKEEGITPIDGKYEVIVIDPPWRYDDTEIPNYAPNGNRGTSPYPTMSMEEIRNIKIPCSDNCVLWLWTTNYFMKDAFTLLKEWGFENKTILTWVKNRYGTGKWLRSQTEHCILAIKGTPIYNRDAAASKSTVLMADMREHSRKPDEFYALVEELCVGHRLDYFAREQRPGWSTYGNDTEKFD